MARAKLNFRLPIPVFIEEDCRSGTKPKRAIASDKVRYMPRVKLHDLVVVLPGITGSILRRADGRDVWAVSGRALWDVLISLGDSLEYLAVPRHDPRGAAPDTPITAAGLINDFHGIFGFWRIDGYNSIVNMLTETFELWRGTPEDGNEQTNLIPFPYDWRLSNRVSARRLKAVVEWRLPAFRNATNNPGAKVILIAHSMGGLVARYYLEVLGGWRDCRALITFGTPYRGAVGSLDYLSNGYKKVVLGQTIFELTAVMRTMPAVYELMPRYRALKKDNDWWRPAEALPLPGIDEYYARAALEFHFELDRAIESNRKNSDYMDAPYIIFPIIGARQPTTNSAVFEEGKIFGSEYNPDWLEAELACGDGTVPRVSATPVDREQELREVFFAERHASLQCNDHVLFDLMERIMQMQAPHLELAQGGVSLPLRTLTLAIEELYAPEEPVELTVHATDVEPFGPVQATVVSRTASRHEVVLVKSRDRWVANLGTLPPGQYRVSVATVKTGPGAPTPVHDVFEVAGL
jgi:pimeloyl-ACP methyl ester carboxylesterase